MKKSFFLLAASLFATAALALFASCSGDGGPAGFSQNGSVTFVFNDGVIKALKGSSSNSSSSLNASAAVSKSLAGIDDVSEYNIKVTLTVDGSDQTKETTMEAGREASVTFSDIAVGVKAKAAVKVLIDDFEYASGESDEITVAEGSNPLTIKARRATLYPIVLWNRLTKENTYKYKNASGTTNTEPDQIKNYTRGARFFGYVDSTSSIQSADLQLDDNWNNKNPIYSFGDNCVYWYCNGKVQIYSAPNYDLSKEIDIETKLTDKAPSLQGNTEFVIRSVSYFDGYLFMSGYAYVSTSEKYFFAALKLENESVTVDQNQDNTFTAMALTKGEQTSSYALYCVPATAIPRVNKKTFQIAGDGIVFDTPPAETYVDFPLDSEQGLYGEHTDCISDLEIVGNVLYASFYAQRLNSINNTEKMVLKEGDAFKNTFFVNSVGGVAKIDLTKSDFEWAAWKNGKKHLGVYENYYWFKEEPASVDYTRSDEMVAMTAPESLSSQYFYGAKKFIAKKPDELVIADDGVCLYIDTDGTSNGVTSQEAIKSCKNMNRVATVNLLEESLSIVDVEVSFSTNISTSTGFTLKESEN